MRSNIYLMSHLKPSLASLEIIFPNKVWNSITLWSLCTTRLVRIVRHTHTSCFSMIHELGLWFTFLVEFWNLSSLTQFRPNQFKKIWINFEYCSNLQSFTNFQSSVSKSTTLRISRDPNQGIWTSITLGCFWGPQNSQFWGPGFLPELLSRSWHESLWPMDMGSLSGFSTPFLWMKVGRLKQGQNSHSSGVNDN